MSKFKLIHSAVIVALIILAAGCVESLVDSQIAVPSVDVFSPASRDTVSIGKTLINFQAADGAGGQGLSHIEVYVNSKFNGRYNITTDGTLPAIYLDLDSTFVSKTISYYLIVYNKQGRQTKSSEQGNILVKDKVPAQPGNLFLLKYDEYSVNLFWDDSSNNETGYEIWRKDDKGGAYRKIKSLPENTISSDDTGLSPFIVYYYKVRAYNASGYSAFSNEATTVNVPPGPWNLEAEAIGATKVHLKWTDFAINENGFIIERTEAGPANWQKIGLAPRNAEDYIDNTVKGNTGYVYRVAYYTSTVVSNYSNEAAVVTFKTEVPPPSGLYNSQLWGWIWSAQLGWQPQASAPAGGTLTSKVDLRWTNNDTSYVQSTFVERKIGNTGKYEVIGSTTKPEILFFGDYLSHNAPTGGSTSNVSGTQTIYFYRVRNKLADNTYTPYSNEIQVIVNTY